MKKNAMLNGMMGLITGDALGNPVQFSSRELIKRNGQVTDMRGGGAFDTPAGTWTDDSSLALATLDALKKYPKKIMDGIAYNFSLWLATGEFTPFGEAFDIGKTCMQAICDYLDHQDWKTCGRVGEYANGNGALMRILPACVYCVKEYEENRLTLQKAVEMVENISALTHNHTRSRIGCGLYFFMVKHLLQEDGTLIEILQRGMNEGFQYYDQYIEKKTELFRYARMKDLEDFAGLPEQKINSSGYVVHTLEAAVWSLLNENNYRDGLLRAVNLGDDADSVGAVAGGLAGLYYGYEGIPEKWLQTIQRREWIEELCKE